MRMRKLCAAFVAICVLAAASLTCFAAENDAEKKWEDYIEESIRVDKTPGLALVTVHDGEADFREWGYANIADNEPMTRETVLQIGSCSKAFTALAVLLLQEEGKLSIEDSVADYIPWWHVTWQGEDADVKIWQLINHCAGISNAKTMAEYEFGSDDALKEKTARIAEDLELSCEPGARFEYSNLDYVLLAYLTEVVSGVPFSDYVVNEIMRPIGMTHSGYDIPTAQGYCYFFGRPVEYDAPRMKGAEGEGFAIVTPEDMSLWMKAQLGLLDLPDNLGNAIEESHRITKEHLAEEYDEMYFNGWFVSEDGLYSHSGMNPNFTSNFVLDLKRGIATFAVSNSVSDAQYYAAYSAYGMLIGNDPDSFEPIERNGTYTTDIFATGVCIAALVAEAIAVIFMLKQKKRSSRTSEKRLLIIRCACLVPLLALTISLPYILGALMGYPGFGYRMIWYWSAQSSIVACLMLDLLLITLIAASIRRYVLRTRFSCPFPNASTVIR